MTLWHKHGLGLVNAADIVLASVQDFRDKMEGHGLCPPYSQWIEMQII